MKNILSLIKIKKNIFILFMFLIIVFSVLISLIFNSYALEEQGSSVSLTSENLNFEKEDPGAFKVIKSAKWIDKGQAEITIELDSVAKKESSYSNIILVLDTSQSMEGEKLNEVKETTINLIETLLVDSNNNVALITFADNSYVMSEFTNDKETLINQVNSLTASGLRNYYKSFINIGNVLENFDVKDNNECLVLFVTDGLPNKDTPNEISHYQYLKQQYSYLKIHAIYVFLNDFQIDLDEVLEVLTKVSDVQSIVGISALNDSLFDASVKTVPYDNFIITDYIDEEYFDISSIDSIDSNYGKVDLQYEGSTPKISWDLTGLSTGQSATLTAKILLKSEYLTIGNTYSTNNKLSISYSLDGAEEIIENDSSPLVSNVYKVIYDGNAPDDCIVEGIPDSREEFVFDTIQISNNHAICEGYQFKGWKIVDDDVTRVSSGNFIMPEKDVILRAEWSVLSITKSLEGTVFVAPTLYKVISDMAVLDNQSSNYVTSSTGINFAAISSDTNGKGVYEIASTQDDEYPIYYYRGAVDNNNVKFANFCWKIVRTTETGGVKLIYNGVPDSEGYCTNTTGTATQIGMSEFNLDPNSPTYNGYMHGDLLEVKVKDVSGTFVFGNDVIYDETTDKYTLQNTVNLEMSTSGKATIGANYHYTCFTSENSCSTINYIFFTGNRAWYDAYYITLSGGNTIETALSNTRTNTKNSNSSTIKSVIDAWYEANMTDYTNMLEDTVWCNDRIFVNSTGWEKDGDATDGEMYYLAYDRAYSLHQPSLECDQKDKFTVEEENGNGALIYPISLLTLDEILYAGGAYDSSNTSYYLYTNQDWWTLSSAAFISDNRYACAWAYNFATLTNGSVYAAYDCVNNVDNSIGVRPSISLKSGIKVDSGTGTSIDPYIVMIEE